MNLRSVALSERLYHKLFSSLWSKFELFLIFCYDNSASDILKGNLVHFSNVFIRKISRSSNRIAELKIFIYLHCQHLLNVYYVPRTIVSAWYIVFLLPRFSCLIFTITVWSIGTIIFLILLLRILRHRFKKKNKKLPSHTARDLKSQGTKWDGLTPELDLLHTTCEVVFYLCMF